MAKDPLTLKDQIWVNVQVDVREFREASGLIRFDDDPESAFYNLLDAGLDTLQERISVLVREVYGTKIPGLTFQVTALPGQQPMSSRNRWEREQQGLPPIKPGRKPVRRS